MLMLGAGINLELLEHSTAETILRQHALHRVLERALRRLLDQLLKGDALKMTDVARVVVIDLVRRLATGNMDLFGVDYNNVVAGIHMRRVFGLMLAAKPARDFAGETAQGLA